MKYDKPQMDILEITLDNCIAGTSIVPSQNEGYTIGPDIDI